MSRTARVLLFAVRVYQSFFSPLMPSACKFYPTCSHYAADAVRIHGARRGSWLALRRVLRCHPFTRGGVDLVPDAVDFPCEAKSSTGFTSCKIDPNVVIPTHASCRGISLFGGVHRREIPWSPWRPPNDSARRFFRKLFGLSYFVEPEAESPQAEACLAGRQACATQPAAPHPAEVSSAKEVRS